MAAPLVVANMNDVLIEEIVRYEHYDSNTGRLLWMANQLQEGSLTISTSETTEKKDARGNTIATFYKGRKAEFKANNALFNLGIAAAQSGGKSTIARGQTGAPVKSVPYSETFEVSSTTLTLKYTPVGATGAEIPYIYVIDDTGYNTTSYAINASADGEHFSLAADTKTLTLPTGIKSGRIMVNYRADIEDALAFTASADDAPTPGRGLLYVKCHNVCDESTKVYCILEFLNAQVSPEAEIGFTTEGTHALTMQMMPSYCDPDKTLYRFYAAV